jgi:hypothetical protein
VLDGVCVVWVRLLKESLEVVCRQSCLALAAAFDSHDTRHVKSARFLVVISIAVGRNNDLLKTLLASLLVTLGALFGVLDDDD